MKSPLKSVDYTFGYLALAFMGGVYFAENNLWSMSRFFIGFSFSGILLLGMHVLLNRIWIEHKVLRAVFGFLLGSLVFFGGAWVYQSRTPVNNPAHYANFLKLSAHQLLIQPVERWKPTAFGERYVAHVLTVNNKKVAGKILISVPPQGGLTLTTDSVYAFYDEVQLPAKPRNPHQFSYRNYLSRKNIFYQAVANSTNTVAVGVAPQSVWLYLTRWRERAQKRIQEHFPDPDVYAIMQALLLGQRQEVSPELNQRYANAGAVHLLAVSGLHVGVVAILLYFFTYPLLYFKKGKWLRFVVSILLLWVFAGVAGFSPSVTRAVFMFTIIGFALLSGRGMHGLSATFLSAFLLLLYEPSFAFEVGFQLSYMAVIGIFVIKPFFDKWWKPKNRILGFYWDLLAVSMAAQLAVMPLSLFYFHQFPGLFALSSLAIIPLLGLILGGGLLVLLLLFAGWHPQGLISAYAELIKTMNAFIGWVAQKETFLFSNIPFDVGLLAAFYLVLFLWVVYGHRRTMKNLALLMLTLVLFQTSIFVRKKQNEDKKAFWVLYQNRGSLMAVQQGKSIRVYKDSIGNQSGQLQSFFTGESLQKIRYLPPQRIYHFDDKIFMVLDHNFTEEIEESPYGLIISNNPQVNPRRALKKIKPQVVIIDGSNYRRTAQDWEQEAQQLQIPTHNLYTSGFYRWPLTDN